MEALIGGAGETCDDVQAGGYLAGGSDLLTMLRLFADAFVEVRKLSLELGSSGEGEETGRTHWGLRWVCVMKERRNGMRGWRIMPFMRGTTEYVPQQLRHYLEHPHQKLWLSGGQCHWALPERVRGQHFR